MTSQNERGTSTSFFHLYTRKGIADGVIYRIAAEVAHGLRLYFNKSLGHNLLYKFERGQYAEQRQMMVAKGDEDPEMSKIYGAEHLLRLFGTHSLEFLRAW